MKSVRRLWMLFIVWLSKYEIKKRLDILDETSRRFFLFRLMDYTYCRFAL